VASGRIIGSPAGARYIESLSPERHGRQPGDSWRHPGDTERHRETLEALEPFSKYVPDDRPAIARVVYLHYALVLLMLHPQLLIIHSLKSLNANVPLILSRLMVHSRFISRAFSLDQEYHRDQ